MDNVRRTFFISPTTLTLDLSSWTIWVGKGSQVALSFLITEISITLDDSPESMIQLCTFLLKISKVSRKGGTLFTLVVGPSGFTQNSRLLF